MASWVSFLVAVGAEDEDEEDEFMVTDDRAGTEAVVATATAVAVVAPFSRSSVPNDRDALTREGIPLLVVVAVGALAGVEGARSMVGFTSKKDADDAGETR